MIDPGLRLRALRKALSGNLAGVIIPSFDSHRSEYLAERDRRREWISGFTGSSGTAVVLASGSAHLWTDGRYWVQAEKEINLDLWTLHKDPGQEIGKFLIKELNPGTSIGVDPYHLSHSEYETLEKDLGVGKVRLIPMERNVIDEIWGAAQPSPPNEPILPLRLEFSGMSWKDKVVKFREEMKKEKCSCLIMTDLTEIAYAFNLRGSDIPYTPVFFSYAAITEHEISLFIREPESLDSHVRDVFLKGIVMKPYDSVSSFIKDFGAKPEKKIWFSNTVSRGLVSSVSEDSRVIKVNPVSLMKAVKNETEIKGFVSCHIRDAAALVRYFAWLEKEIPKGCIDEYSGAMKLDSFRKEMVHFVGLSFPTISSSGPNAAIPHYRPMPQTSRLITDKEVYLVDSGAQYKDGTTDVTRTLHFGTPSDHEKDCFTRVLKGQIRLTKAVFPRKVKGHSIDSLARLSLWEAGLDYSHSTGHGVGAYLNVHEGPIGIYWFSYPLDPGLDENMVLSIEPGYYEDGNFGIRLENLAKIVLAQTEHNYGDKGYLTFDSLTCVPIQVKMINPKLLSAEEVAFIDEYHSKCREVVGPLLRELGHTDALNWLIRETEPIG